MIRDEEFRSRVAKDWETIRSLSATGRSFMVVLTWVIERWPEQLINLPLVLAYSNLDAVLSELISQGTFACPRWQLGSKMEASRTALPWQDYLTVNQGRQARNDLAHEAKLVGRADAVKYIGAIETELKAWGILTQ